MAGASLTLVKLDDEIEELLAAPAEVADPRLLTRDPPSRPAACRSRFPDETEFPWAD